MVIMRQDASGLMLTSPVIRPTSLKRVTKSRYFWLLRALIGDVYTHRVMCFMASAIAYSATTVLPADVCAATNTQSPCSRWTIASLWKMSSWKGQL